MMGGSFNPPHRGHFAMARAALASAPEDAPYDAVIMVPAFQNPHKPGAEDPGPEHRLAMLRAAAKGRKGIVVDDCEIRRRGVSYTVETLRFLVKRYAPSRRPGLLIGDDLAGGFSTWRNPEEILSIADILVAARQGGGPFDWPHREIANAPVAVSSSLIRRRIAAGLSFGRLVPLPVYRYITEHGLYVS
jgi:nicotinate-nucleotide adenylyltransferase